MPRSEYELQLEEPEMEPEYGLDAPLLEDDDDDGTDHHAPEANGLGSDAAGGEPRLHAKTRRFRASSLIGVHSPRRVVILIAIIKFIIICGGMMLLVPYGRLIEDSFCHAFYNDKSPGIIDEMKCKEDEIQSRMGYFGGWSALLNAILGLIFAFPYGILADKIGRKPTVMFAYLGIAASIGAGPIFLKVFQQAIRDNPYILLSGAFFQVFGGGFAVFLNTLYAMVADLSSDDQKATFFLYLTFGSSAGGILGPIMAGLMMQRFGPWVPIYCVLTILPVILGLLMLLPETLAVTLKNRQLATDGSRRDDAAATTFRDHMAHGLRELNLAASMLKDVDIPKILGIFFVQNARFTAYSTTMTQYISKYFGWTIAQATLILSPFGVLNLIVLALMHTASQVLMSPRFRMSPFRKDLTLTRISTCILVCGSMVQGLSNNGVLFMFGVLISTFGAADSPLARATVSHYVQHEYTSRLHALISMIEVVGSFIGGPVVAWCFDRGLKMRGIWTGLPWFYVSFLMTLALVALCTVKPPKKRVEDPGPSSDSDDDDEYLPDAPLRLD